MNGNLVLCSVPGTYSRFWKVTSHQVSVDSVNRIMEQRPEVGGVREEGVVCPEL